MAGVWLKAVTNPAFRKLLTPVTVNLRLYQRR